MQHPRKLLVFSAVLALLAAPIAAQVSLAQSAKGQAPKAQPPKGQSPGQDEAPEPTQPSAPYDADLERLAEILGALQYLRTICHGKEGQAWREQMQALLDAEAPAGDRRRKIIANYNRGYRGFQQTYRTCTPAADLAIRRYLQEGARIARDITARYAN